MSQPSISWVPCEIRETGSQSFWIPFSAFEAEAQQAIAAKKAAKKRASQAEWVTAVACLCWNWSYSEKPQELLSGRKLLWG